MKNLKENDFSQVDLPVDYLAWSNITGKVLSTYGNYPCKIRAGIFAVCLRGTIRVGINLTEYVIRPHDFIFLVPGSFIQVRETSKDAKLAFVGFSSSFMNTIEVWKIATGFLSSLISNPVLSLSDKTYSICKDAFNLVSRILNSKEFTVTQGMMVATMNILIESVTAMHGQETKSVPETRDRTIFREFLQQAFIHYRRQHKVSFYAKAARLTLSHFCAVVNKASGKTAREIIMNLIIMDAKGQLKGTVARVNKIAESLGFDNPTTFTRYFREYTGMTPQEYRNSL